MRLTSLINETSKISKRRAGAELKQKLNGKRSDGLGKYDAIIYGLDSSGKRVELKSLADLNKYKEFELVNENTQKHKSKYKKPADMEKSQKPQPRKDLKDYEDGESETTVPNSTGEKQKNVLRKTDKEVIDNGSQVYDIKDADRLYDVTGEKHDPKKAAKVMSKRQDDDEKSNKKNIKDKVENLTREQKEPSTLSNDLKKVTDNLRSAIEEAQRISKEEGVTQHVNHTGKGQFDVSDWYDSDNTVASFENGRRINETITMSEKIKSLTREQKELVLRALISKKLRNRLIEQIEPEEEEAPETEAPETEAPETEAPETEAPETEAPETETPETETPEEPASEAPIEEPAVDPKIAQLGLQRFMKIANGKESAQEKAALLFLIADLAFSGDTPEQKESFYNFLKIGSIKKLQKQ